MFVHHTGRCTRGAVGRAAEGQGRAPSGRWERCLGLGESSSAFSHSLPSVSQDVIERPPLGFGCLPFLFSLFYFFRIPYISSLPHTFSSQSTHSLSPPSLPSLEPILLLILRLPTTPNAIPSWISTSSLPFTMNSPKISSRLNMPCTRHQRTTSHTSCIHLRSLAIRVSCSSTLALLLVGSCSLPYLLIPSRDLTCPFPSPSLSSSRAIVRQ